MDLWENTEASYRERTPQSERAYHELRESIPAGVASTYRAFDPYPMVIERADGPYLYDVDGNRYIDFDLNNGCLVLPPGKDGFRASLGDIPSD